MAAGLLGGRFLTNYINVNAWQDYAQEVKLIEYNASVQTVQLLDRAYDKSYGLQGGLSSPGRRYIPVPPSTLTVTFVNIEYVPGTSPLVQQQFTRFCTQIAPPTNATTQDDGSIWQFPILATDYLNGTVSLVFTLTENVGVTPVVSTFRMENALLISTTQGC
jgi:hypothetical protein